MPKKLTKEQLENRVYGNRVRSCIRRAWSKSPGRYEALKNDRRVYQGDNKRQRFEHQCNICKEWFKQSEVQIDHIIPCGGFFTPMYEIDEVAFKHFCYIMFCGPLQKLCKPCHNVKTAQDAKVKRGE